MSDLPASIEAYLEEAGFSQTELVVLKRLLEQEALTLRELAAKTGRSTGVLDQAMKKLVAKGIVTKETINNGPKYVLRSLQSVVDWVENDMEAKQVQLRRKHANFESFIATIKVDRQRPDMQYFEGEDGIKAAYEELLRLAKKETLHYFPVTTTIEEDPLRDFRVQYFRKRRQLGIFSRYVVHNDPLGRRFVSRDPFEYRQTILVEPEQYLFTFEKVIAGDTVACFDHIKKNVCFMRFPEFAASERAMFEKLWQKKTAPQPVVASQPASPATHPMPVRYLH
ncbi:winged helix-turn-helix transcriptional regulator [Candidatus Peregrinibacteria bacterium]|nr:winged helix-turn-helix transcriptional regulator [Candidatus Peregrinibacteria bacterium]